MSLRDTIEGARSEAKENVSNLAPKKKDGEKDDEAKVAAYDPFNPGKASAATGRPKTEAGSSVRAEGKYKGATPLERSSMTKEEKKAERARERAREDQRTRAYDLILKGNPEYKRTEKVWWILLGIGFGSTVVSLLVAYFLGGQDLGTTSGVVSIVALVLAYAFIIGGFIYDLVKRRPFRKAAEKRLASMNDKHVADFLAQAGKAAADEDAGEAGKAGKDAGKAVKVQKAGKSGKSGK